MCGLLHARGKMGNDAGGWAGVVVAWGTTREPEGVRCGASCMQRERWVDAEGTGSAVGGAIVCGRGVH